MEEFEQQQGISFLLVFFTGRNEYYYLRYKELKSYVDRVKEGHANNFKYDELDPRYFLKPESGAAIHYLKGLQLDLQER